MNFVNPRYAWREWIIAKAYERAEQGNFSDIKEIQDVLTNPYEDQNDDIDEKFNSLRPFHLFNKGGISHYSCSS